MQLYEKITSASGRVTYKEHKPATDILDDRQIEPEQVVAILTTLMLSIMMSVSEQLAPHTKISRETKLLEQALVRYAQLNGGKLDPAHVDVGVQAWNAAVKAIQDGLLQVTQ